MTLWTILLLSLSLLASAQSTCNSVTQCAEQYLRKLSPFDTADVSPSMLLSEQSPVHPSLFGPIRDLVASQNELEPYYHPRVVVNKDQWEDLLAMYADPANFDRDGSWSRFFRTYTLSFGPESGFLLELAELERTPSPGGTSPYKGIPYSATPAYEQYRQSLLPLAREITKSNSYNADSFVICALWASVARKQKDQGREPFIPLDTVNVCIDAAVAWSKITIAHRAYFCNPECPRQKPDGEFTAWWYLWDTTRKFSLSYNWFAAGTGIAFTYDLLYDELTLEQRTILRSGIAMFVMNRYAWGASETSTSGSPNAIIDPHRIFSNWAAYNSNLYLANLAIEGEEGFDGYATAELQANTEGSPDSTGLSGFNRELHQRYSALLEEYMLHSFYPDGATFEDGYSYFIAMREGSLGLLASHRRGSNVLGTPRFRNIIHNAAQMSEPWRCGNLIGHGSGGGNLYNAYPALFRYVYPQGELPGMIWRMRYGDFQKKNPCRIIWAQSYLQLAFLGGEHHTAAESPGTMDASLQKHFKSSFYSPRRGLLIARSSILEDAVYMHFDARPDAFLVGHDNADRGVFTFTALRQTWIDELPWRQNIDSRKHSLMHIDGLAQDWKAPAAQMRKVKDDGDVVIASADLTYAYNVHWSRRQSRNGVPPNSQVTVYDENGNSHAVTVPFPEKEQLDPWTLGWPANDSANDIGFREGMTMHGTADVGFSGLWNWKRPYRTQAVNHMVRSAILVRSTNNGLGYGVIVDSVSAGSGQHGFESYLILNRAVAVDTGLSSCQLNRCKIVLLAEDKRLEILVDALGSSLSFRSETFDGSKQRLVIRSMAEMEEEFWMMLFPTVGDVAGIDMSRDTEGRVTVVCEGSTRVFAVNPLDHTVEEMQTQSTHEYTPLNLQ